MVCTYISRMNVSEPNDMSVQPPYDDMDLSEIVTHVNRSTKRARDKLANDDVTLAFLDAGMSLATDLFSEAPDPADDEDARPTMKFLSSKQVLARAQRRSPQAAPTLAKFRDRWTAQRYFLADFIAYALTARHWSLHMALSQSAADLLNENENFVQAVHEVAFQDLLLVLDMPAYRFQLLAAASAAADPVAAEALKKMYATINKAWCSLYEQVFTRYGIKFRDGWSVEKFNLVMQSTAEGLGMRLLASTQEPILNRTSRTSILGDTALALFIAIVDTGDGHSVENLVLGSIANLRTK